MASPDRSGTSVGRYRLVALLGRGGMGEVYEAVDTEKDRTVALKLLPTNLSGDDDFRARFLRESQTVARLNDPHIIPIHDFGDIDGQLFLDMRIVRGRDLRSVIGQGPLAPDRAVAIVEQIAAALDTAHASGLLHRDVKPENVLLAPRDFAYLADFGLAQAAGQTRLTATGTAIGSFAYMAPERFGGDVPPGPASDVYALACVLYECLTGRQPFGSSSIEQMIAGHLSSPVPASGTVLDAVIAAGMAKNPADRPPSAGALATAARDVLDGRRPSQPAVAHTPTMVAPTPTAVADHASYPPGGWPPQQESPQQASPQQQTGGSRGARTAVIAGGVAALVVVAAGAAGWFALSDDGEAGTAAVTSSANPAPVTVTETRDASSQAAAEPSSAGADDTSRPRRATGDLGLPTPISTPACDGTTITVVAGATKPGDYAAEVAAMLARYPGSQYLRTDQSCASLKQSADGNPIYAVYYAGTSLADTCAAKARGPEGAYTRRLDDTTPVGTELC
ncbi:serine/threonine-protein kinase [Gordonia shandongensis]|uniref:serine/threonine-protein kinase n=1 Tax=Gordonia shandongensis TaxID=376351 RepID=UPI0004028395|nr:serine/threonine-protein kinase [Gordonia shandongensis]